ncbi:MAG: hypothetical protein E7620_09015 [Ruminococcaceae bacterium]|nr:hypothetical protein [Oscillospiraceae bacterium]
MGKASKQQLMETLAWQLNQIRERKLRDLNDEIFRNLGVAVTDVAPEEPTEDISAFQRALEAELAMQSEQGTAEEAPEEDTSADAVSEELIEELRRAIKAAPTMQSEQGTAEEASEEDTSADAAEEEPTEAAEEPAPYEDVAAAMRWYRSAAEPGNADARSNLGVSEDDRGVVEDAAAALRWYRSAAEPGNADAQSNLGVSEDDRGVVEDVADDALYEAVDWPEAANVSANGEKKGDGVFKWSLGSEGPQISLRLSNQTGSNVNVDAGKIYDQRASNLIDASRLVRSQNLFGTETNLEPLIARYPFVPFDFQLQAVKQMLNCFEAKGVFGDQVGLGKTVEALISADAMFFYGAIRNAMLVVPHKIWRGWIAEINQKFPSIFSVRNRDLLEQHEFDLGAAFSETVTLIKEENESEDPAVCCANRLYVVTDEMIKSYVGDIANLEGALDAVMAMKRPMDHQTEFPALYNFRSDLCRHAQNPRRGIQFFPRSRWEEWYRQWEQEHDGDVCPNEVLEYMLDTYREARERFLEYYQVYGYQVDTELDATIRETIEEIEERLRENNACIEGLNSVAYLYDRTDRLVDLMIVDEVHSFYGGESVGNVTELGLQSSPANVLARFARKYCILMSATPVRTCLQDVFELVYIVDPNRFGDYIEEGANYFYRTVCGITPSREEELGGMSPEAWARELPHKLNYMMEDEGRRRNLFGLINNFFIRRRIEDVEDDMKGAADKPYSNFCRKEQAVVEELRERIIGKMQLHLMQVGVTKEGASRRAQRAFLDFCEGNQGLADDVGLLRVAMNTVLIEVLAERAENGMNNTAAELKKSRLIHGIVDWRRDRKQGILLKNNRENTSPEERAALVYEQISGVVSAFQRYQRDGRRRDLDRALSSVCVTNMTMNESVECLEKAKSLCEELSDVLRHDAVLYYIERFYDNDAVRERVLQGYRRALNDCGYFRDVKVNPEVRGAVVNLKHHNTLSIVDAAYQAGVNFQKYRALVFAQMDIMGERLMEPVDVEQWIGRIHRTGQVKTCYAITVPAAEVRGERLDPEFLTWYYGILSDPEGFDLYGNTTPDVAFLQPIVVDYLRALFEKGNLLEFYEDQAISEERLRTAGFSKLMEWVYFSGIGEFRDEVRDKIREFCRIEGFGKKMNGATSERRGEGDA